jgi:hypothetical protein
VSDSLLTRAENKGEKPETQNKVFVTQDGKTIKGENNNATLFDPKGNKIGTYDLNNENDRKKLRQLLGDERFNEVIKAFKEGKTIIEIGEYKIERWARIIDENGNVIGEGNLNDPKFQEMIRQLLGDSEFKRFMEWWNRLNLERTIKMASEFFQQQAASLSNPTEFMIEMLDDIRKKMDEKEEKEEIDEEAIKRYRIRKIEKDEESQEGKGGKGAG